MQTGAQIIYSKYAGTEVEFNDVKHLILKEDDIVGILETDDIKDLKPLNDRVFIKVCLLSFISRLTIISTRKNSDNFCSKIYELRLLRQRRKQLEGCC